MHEKPMEVLSHGTTGLASDSVRSNSEAYFYAHIPPVAAHGCRLFRAVLRTTMDASSCAVTLWPHIQFFTWPVTPTH